ncbi:hypothetical protein ACVBEG_27865 [Pseudomonas sp. GG8]
MGKSGTRPEGIGCNATVMTWLTSQASPAMVANARNSGRRCQSRGAETLTELQSSQVMLAYPAEFSVGPEWRLFKEPDLVSGFFMSLIQTLSR